MSQSIKAREIIVSMVMYYQTHPRAQEAGACYYSMPVFSSVKETRCAVGQFLQPEVRELVSTEEVSLRQLVGEYGNDGSMYSVDDVLVPEARGLTLNFWECLQEIHDTDENWSEEIYGSASLSEVGWLNINDLAKKNGVTDPITEEDLQIP